MNFIFGNENINRGDNWADVPVGINSKTALLEALFMHLHFPEYFGGNWDALDECIRDLSWLPQGDVVLCHKDLPLLEDRAALSTYLSILKDAIEKWSVTKERKLIVVFPPNVESIVRSVLGK